jgi:hypothetical protein
MMTTAIRLRGLFLAVGIFAAAAQFAAADPAPASAQRATTGALVGIVTDASKSPLAHATVTAASEEGHIRATVAGTDGVFSFSDLPPGLWTLTVQADGFPDAEVQSLPVTASKATRRDVVMNVVTEPGSAKPAVASSGADNPVPVAPKIDAGAALRASIAAAAKPVSPSLGSLRPVGAEAQVLPDALTSPDAGTGVDNFTPFAFGDFTWLNGGPRNKAPVFDTKFFTPDIRFDAHYMEDFNRPVDHTIVGSTESFRSGEFQLEQVSFGGDFHWENVRARFLSMMGLFATTTPRNDASSGVGQWDLQDAYRYLSEANAGYHFNVGHGLNVDAGIFVSYIGLFSYYNYDNWTYQPSYVSSNTPWFFNGLRIQYFPSNTLKIEPWIINGWQSYGRFNKNLGFGGQILWQPNENLKLVFNNYGVGEDNLSVPLGQAVIGGAKRIHTDDSIEYRYFNRPSPGISKAAFSFTVDAGCEYGGSLNCTGGQNKTAFLGWMLYNRVWFANDKMAVTVGGGSMNNPGRYLTLLPPINGATAATGSPYFTENPGQHAYMWDTTVNFQYMPKDWITWWTEVGYRHADIPYFAGSGGVTPPNGNNGQPGQFVCNNGTPAGTDPTQLSTLCAANGGVWYPDLRTQELKWSAGVLVKF